MYNTNITQETKDKWLTALRSGEYTQTHLQLYSPTSNSYCVLGVLGEIIGVDVKTAYKSDFDYSYNPYDKIVGTLGGNTLSSELYRRNDLQRLSFNELADWIEDNIIAKDNEE